LIKKKKVPGLKGIALKDQLKLFKNAGAPNLKQGLLPTKVGDICKALLDAIDLQENGTWRIVEDEESDTETIDLQERGEDEDEDEDD
jgi:hypothetical protein